MKILVCVKQAIDSEAVLAFDAQGNIAKEGQTLVIDPYSEFAVEKAVQLKEAHGAEVVVACIGGSQAQSAVRHALAMGAESAILVQDDALAEANPETKAAVLARIAQEEDAQVVMGGCKSSDTAHAQVMPRIATLLGYPHVNTCVELEIEGETLHATREIDDGVATIDVTIPAVICAQQGLAEPRYPTVRDIMQSKRKPIVTCAASDFEGACMRGAQVVCVAPKPKRAGGSMVEGDTAQDKAHEAVRLLRDVAKVF